MSATTLDPETGTSIDSSAKPRHEALERLVCQLGTQSYRFTTITPASHARVNARAGNALARSIEDVLGWSRRFRPAMLPEPLFAQLREAGVVARAGADGPGGEAWRATIRVSSLAETLFVHSAFPTVAPDSVFFGPDTYKFVDAIRAHLGRRSTPVRRAADVCCGAGPGALAIAEAYQAAEVLMLDINQRALQFAAVNAAAAGALGARAMRSDLLNDTSGLFDLVVAHPPYLVDRGARVYRHGGGPLGAALALDLVRTGIQRLNHNGTLLLFTGVAMIGGADPFHRELTAMLHGSSLAWSYREVDPDVFGEELDHAPYDEVDRIALVVLEATRTT